MAATSSMLPLGTELPRFTLPDVTTGRAFDSASLLGSVSIVAMLCNHCPYVKHVAPTLGTVTRDLIARGVRVAAVSSNDVLAYPDYSPALMVEEARLRGYAFPYLFDEAQDVARAFGAVCTPEFYVFDPQGKLAYRGRMDASSPKNGLSATGVDLRAAVDALLAGGRPTDEQHASIGCSIKWKGG